MTSLSLLTLSGLALAGGDHKVEVCHRGLTLEVDEHAVKAHLAHGDTLPGTWYADGDGDGFGDDGEAVTACEAPFGYVSTPGDCDDADAGRNPDADEVCNGGDDDCDGLTDDSDSDVADQEPWYADQDGDGHGTGDATLACSGGPGEVLLGDDCDDEAPDVYPGAPERCDGFDQDCDVDADEGLPDSDGDAVCDEIDLCAGHDDGVDSDGDGVADGCDECPGSDDGVDENENGVPDACEGADEDGDGFTNLGGDCNDHDDAVNPDAVEVCGNGRDDDCDGTPGVCAPLSGVITPAQIPIQIAGGGRAHLRPDLDGDGLDELFLGGRRLARPLDGDPSTQDALLVSEAPTGSWIADARGWGFGFDLDRDEVPDVLLADIGNDRYNLNAGLVYFGDVEVPTGNVPWQDMVFARFYGQTWGGQLGISSWDAGDLDGDGYHDAVIAEYGGFHVMTAARLEALQASNTEVIVPTISCVGRNHRGGGPVDFDGDGIHDVVLVRSYTDITGNGNGVQLIVVWGDALSGIGPNAIPVGTSCDQIVANPSWGRSLISLGGLGETASFGDLNGDGKDEIVFGGPDFLYAPNPNFNIANPSLWIFSLGSGSRGSAPVATTRIIGPENVGFGSHLGPAGDLDGDGIGDLMVASQPGNSYTGRLWVLATPAVPGVYQVQSATNPAYLTPILEIAGTGRPYFGFAPGHLDVDLDGVDELTFSDYYSLYFVSLDGR